MRTAIVLIAAGAVVALAPTASRAQCPDPPTITCDPSFAVDTDPGQCGAVGAFNVAVSDDCSEPSAICTPLASGDFFPVGATTVTCTATDDDQNSASCSLTITVNDTEPPAIGVQAPLTAHSSDGNPVPVTFAPPAATDNCGATTVCSPPSGSAFAIGTALVTCTATDPSSNTATTSFLVTVTAPAVTEVPTLSRSALAVLSLLLAAASWIVLRR